MYTGVVHAIREMYKENGIRTFYKGEIILLHTYVLVYALCIVYMHYLDCVVYYRITANTNTDCPIYGTAVWNLHDISSHMENVIRSMYKVVCMHSVHYCL